MFDLATNVRRPDGWTSADAAGLAILPGLVKYDEAARDVPITHAFRFTARATNGCVWPASHRAGSTVGALPMDARWNNDLLNSAFAGLTADDFEVVQLGWGEPGR